MSPEKEKALKKLAPNLFYGSDEPGASSTPSVMFGCECGDGWYNILSYALEKISKLAYEYIPEECLEMPSFKIVQIKEKYGTLSIYMSQETSEMDQIIRLAETASSVTCEECGKSGQLRDKNHWYYTSCEDHVR